jgi:hypothetical protein
MKINEIINESLDSAFAQDVSSSPYVLNYWEGRMKVYYEFDDSMWKTSLHIYFKIDDRVDITGGGNAMKIFSTAAKSVEENLSKIIKPSTRRIHIQGKNVDGTRVPLFRKRAVPRLNSIITQLDSNWKYAGEQSFSGVTEFYWTR